MASEVPRGLRFSKAALERNRNEYKFSRVNHEGKAVTTVRMTLNSVKRIWAKNADVVYNLTYRVAGEFNDVADALTSAGFSEAEVNASMAGVLTSENVDTTMRAVFDEEAAAVRRYCDSQGPGCKPKGFNLDNYTWFGNNLSKAQRVSAKTGAAAKGAGRKGGRKSLTERLAEAVAAKKVFDVSKYNADSGVGR